MSLKILVIPCSLRQGANSKALSVIIGRELESVGAQVTILDPSEFDMPNYNQDIEDSLRSQKLFPEIGADFKRPDSHKDMLGVHNLESAYRKFSGSDGVFIVCPEYNATYPSYLKNLLDWVSRIDAGVLSNMPTAIATSSPGGLGGIRCVSSLVELLYMGLSSALFPKYFSLGDFHQHVHDKEMSEGKLNNLRLIVEEFVQFAESLQAFSSLSRSKLA